MDLWYYNINGQLNGPVDEKSLRSMINAGLLGPHVSIWKIGMTQWISAVQLSSLNPVKIHQFSSPPPLPNELNDLDFICQTMKNKLWKNWQIFVFNFLTFGLFSYFVIASWSKPFEYLTQKPKLNAWSYIFYNICTLGLFTFFLFLRRSSQLYYFARNFNLSTKGTQWANHYYLYGFRLLSFIIFLCIWFIGLNLMHGEFFYRDNSRDLEQLTQFLDSKDVRFPNKVNYRPIDSYEEALGYKKDLISNIRIYKYQIVASLSLAFLFFCLSIVFNTIPLVGLQSNLIYCIEASVKG